MIVDTKKDLSRIFKIIIDEEKKIDNHRVILYESEGFSPLNLFYEIDIDKKNFITDSDLHSIVKSTIKDTNLRYLGLIVLLYDNDKQFKLSFEDFINLITPHNYMFNQKKTQNKEVTPLIKYSFSRIIETHLELIIKIKSILYENEQKFQIENILNMFKYLLGNNIHLSKNNINVFMFDRGIILDKLGQDLLFKKLDFNHDDKVDFNDFRSFLMIFKDEPQIGTFKSPREENTDINIPNHNSNKNFNLSQGFYGKSVPSNISCKENIIIGENLANYFITIKNYEIEIEELKIRLTNNHEFNYHNLLEIFTNESKDRISKDSFKKGLTMFGVYESYSTIELFSKRYGKLLDTDYLRLKYIL